MALCALLLRQLSKFKCSEGTGLEHDTINERVHGISMAGATIFSTFYANCRYCTVEIDKGDGDKTAFASHHRIYRLKTIALGLINAISTFQRAMKVLLSIDSLQFTLMYLENFVVFRKLKD